MVLVWLLLWILLLVVVSCCGCCCCQAKNLTNPQANHTSAPSQLEMVLPNRCGPRTMPRHMIRLPYPWRPPTGSVSSQRSLDPCSPFLDAGPTFDSTSASLHFLKSFLAVVFPSREVLRRAGFFLAHLLFPVACECMYAGGPGKTLSQISERMRYTPPSPACGLRAWDRTLGKSVVRF